MEWDFTGLAESINKAFLPYLYNKSRYLLLYGGAGSGKSHFIAQKLLIRILKAIECGYVERFLALRKTSPATRRSVFVLLQSYINKWNLNDEAVINKTDMSITFIGGSQILCMGLDDPEKIKSIEGVTGIWLEEGTSFSEIDFKQLDLRLRGDTPSYKQVILSFNPINAFIWLNERFFENDEPKPGLTNTTIMRSTWRDNQFIDDDYKAILTAYKDEDLTLWQIYDQGLWGILENLIYSAYDIIPDTDVPDRFDEVIYGLDWGYNHPLAMIKVGMLDSIPYERELIYERKVQPGDIVSLLQAQDISPGDPIYADPSRPDLIDMVFAAGFNIEPADNSVKAGIDFVKRQRPQIAESSENHRREKQSYKYKVDKDGNVLKSEEPVKAFDDLQDAERYALYSHFGGDEPEIWPLN